MEIQFLGGIYVTIQDYLERFCTLARSWHSEAVMVADTTLAPVQNTFKNILTDADMIRRALDQTFISGCKVFPRVARYSESATSGQGVIRDSEWLKNR